MTITTGYVTVSDVRKFFLGAPINNIYSDSDIEGMINRYGLEVERISGSAWRAVTVTDEMHTVGPNVNNGPYYNIYSFHLKHGYVRALTSMMIFTGSDWEDYVVTKTEGRADGYFIDYVNGIVYINGYIWLRHAWDAKISYTYGKTTVDADAWDLNLRYVARQIFGATSYTVAIPESGSGRQKDRYDRNEERIRELEARLANTFQILGEGDWI